MCIGHRAHGDSSAAARASCGPPPPSAARPPPHRGAPAHRPGLGGGRSPAKEETWGVRPSGAPPSVCLQGGSLRPRKSMDLPGGAYTTNRMAGPALQSPAIAWPVHKSATRSQAESWRPPKSPRAAAAPAELDQFAHASVAVAKHASGGRPHQEHPGVLSHNSGAKMPEQSGGAVVLVGATGSAAQYHIWLRPAAPSE